MFYSALVCGQQNTEHYREMKERAVIARREIKYRLDLEVRQMQVSLSFRVINNQSVFPPSSLITFKFQV